MSAAADGPLAGIKVVDLTIMIAGPYAGRLLADNGAEVTKIEPPEGDPMRRRAPLRDGHSSYFGSLNAGKHSVALDLKEPADLARARELIAEADVLVENFRPGVMDRLGLAYATCRKLNPGLVYCSISGYGQSGPKARYPAYAPILHAVSGFDLTLQNYQRAEEPPPTGIFIADVMAGQVSYAAILTALVGRGRTGLGDHLDVSLYEIMLSTLVYETQATQDPGNAPGKTVYRPVRVGDDFVLIAAVTDRNVRTLMELMDDPSLLTDERFVGMTEREKHWADWQARIAGWAQEYDADALEKLLLDNGVPCARYRTVGEALRDPQLELRRSLREAQDLAGGFRFLGPPWASAHWPAPGVPTSVPTLTRPSARD